MNASLNGVCFLCRAAHGFGVIFETLNMPIVSPNIVDEWIECATVNYSR
jgi:hypothetical protein